MSFARRLALVVFLLGSTLLVLMTVVYYFANRVSSVELVHLHSTEVAQDLSHSMDLFLKEKGRVANTIATAPILTDSVSQSNSEFSRFDDSERQEQIDNLNAKWLASVSMEDPIIQSALHNPLAEYLRRQQKAFPGEYGEVFVTNRYGVLVASTGKLTTLAHSHKYWWQASYHDGKGITFFDDRGYDTSVEGYVLGVVIPIRQGGEIIGILKCNLNVTDALTEVLRSLSHHEDGESHRLVRAGGLVVLEEGVEPLSKSVPSILVEAMKEGESGSLITEGIEGAELLAYAPVYITKGSDKHSFGGSPKSADHRGGNIGESWYVVGSVPLQQILKAAKRSTRTVVVIGILFCLIMALGSALVGKTLSRPIMTLVEHSRRIGKGNLDTEVEITSKGEFGILAKALNSMVQDLRQTMISRDKLVEEIKQRKQAEEKFGVAFHNNPLIMGISDIVTKRFLDVNETFCHSFGLTRKNVVGRTPEELGILSAEERDAVAVESAEKGYITNRETRFFRQDGSPIESLFHATVLTFGEDKALLGIVQDVTKRKQAEARIAGLNQFMEVLIRPGGPEEKSKCATDALVKILDVDFARIWIVRLGDRCEAGCCHAKAQEGPNVCSHDRCLHLVASSGRYTHIDGEVHRRVPIGLYKIGRVASGETPGFITNEVTKDPRVHDHKWAAKLGLVSFAGNRLFSPTGEVIGVLAVFSKHAMGAEEQALLKTISNTTAQVLHNAITEEALRDSEARFRELTEQFEEGISLADAEGALTFVNPAYCNLMGYSEKELLQMKVMDLSPHAKGPYVFQEVLKNRSIVREAKLRRKDGSEFLAEIRGSSVEIQGELCALGIVRDITKIRYMEEARRASLALFQDMDTLLAEGAMKRALEDGIRLTGSKIGFYHEVNPDEQSIRLVTWSKETLDICEAGELTTHYAIEEAGIWVDCVRERRAIIVNDYASASGKRGLPEGHTPLMRMLTVPILKHGKVVAIMGVGNSPNNYESDDIETLNFMLGNAWMVAERDRAEKSIKAYSDRFNLASDAGKIGVWQWNIVTNELDWDDRMMELYATRPGEFSGAYDAWRSRVHPNDQAKAERILIEAVEGDGHYNQEFRVVWPQGEVRTIRSAAMSQTDATGRNISMTGVNWDITEQKRAEADLKEYAEAQAVLLREVNHRVKNNLAAIVGLIQGEADHVTAEGPESTPRALSDLENRVHGLAVAHSMLSATAWRPLVLGDLCEKVARSALRGVPRDKTVEIRVAPSPVTVSSDQAHHLALVVMMDIEMPRMDGMEATRRIQETCPTPVIALTAYESPEFMKKASEAGVSAYLIKPPEVPEMERAITVALARHGDLMESRRLNAELALRNKELEKALAKIKTLKGLLPICSFCKKVRDDEGYWQEVEIYVQKHTESEFSHTYCPECAKEHYPGLYDRLIKKSETRPEP